MPSNETAVPDVYGKWRRPERSSTVVNHASQSVVKSQIVKYSPRVRRRRKRLLHARTVQARLLFITVIGLQNLVSSPQPCQLIVPRPSDTPAVNEAAASLTHGTITITRPNTAAHPPTASTSPRTRYHPSGSVGNNQSMLRCPLRLPPSPWRAGGDGGLTVPCRRRGPPSRLSCPRRWR